MSMIMTATTTDDIAGITSTVTVMGAIVTTIDPDGTK
jgi:hypothetical protein